MNTFCRELAILCDLRSWKLRHPTYLNSSPACWPRCGLYFPRHLKAISAGQAFLFVLKFMQWASLLLCRNGDTQYEVAWNWLWDNVAQLLASSPAMRCRVLMSTLPSWLMADPIFNEISMKCYVPRSKLWEHPTRGRPGPLMQLHAGLPSGHMTP